MVVYSRSMEYFTCKDTMFHRNGQNFWRKKGIRTFRNADDKGKRGEKGQHRFVCVEIAPCTTVAKEYCR